MIVTIYELWVTNEIGIESINTGNFETLEKAYLEYLKLKENYFIANKLRLDMKIYQRKINIEVFER